MGAPVLIGAGIGAAASLATGRNPLQGALLGGIGGGTFGGSAGLGSGFTEGGLFSLGSEVGKSAVTNGVTSAGTAFGANQAPLAGMTGISPEQVATTALDTTYAGPVSSTVGDIHTGLGISPDSIVSSKNIPISQYTSGIHTQDPTQLARASKEVSGQTFTDGVADQIMPRFSEPIRVTEQASKTGGYEKPLYERAYESVINYAQQNPLQLAGLGLVASGGIKPKQPQISGASVGSITKGTPPQTAGTPLKVRRPTRFA